MTQEVATAIRYRFLLACEQSRQEPYTKHTSPENETKLIGVQIFITSVSLTIALTWIFSLTFFIRRRRCCRFRRRRRRCRRRWRGGRWRWRAPKTFESRWRRWCCGDARGASEAGRRSQKLDWPRGPGLRWSRSGRSSGRPSAGTKECCD